MEANLFAFGGNFTAISGSVANKGSQQCFYNASKVSLAQSLNQSASPFIDAHNYT
jgi:hypothetical protein